MRPQLQPAQTRRHQAGRESAMRPQPDYEPLYPGADSSDITGQVLHPKGGSPVAS